VPNEKAIPPVCEMRFRTSARITFPESFIVVAAMGSTCVLWARGFDVDQAIFKCGAAVTAYTFVVTAPYRALETFRLHVARQLFGRADLGKFL
jgi:biotin synthase-like enzyme